MIIARLRRALDRQFRGITSSRVNAKSKFTMLSLSWPTRLSRGYPNFVIEEEFWRTMIIKQLLVSSTEFKKSGITLVEHSQRKRIVRRRGILLQSDRTSGALIWFRDLDIIGIYVETIRKLLPTGCEAFNRKVRETTRRWNLTLPKLGQYTS